MELDTFRELLSKPGQAALAAAHALAPTESSFLASFGKLRKRHPPALAKAALETVLLRRKASARFSQAERMYFTREALEQASGEVVSRYRASRFAEFNLVLDLCCGVGMDAIQLALVGKGVYGIEVDRLKVAMANANAAACGVQGRTIVQVGDVLTTPIPNAQAVFVDPSRRAGGRRVLDPEKYEPPLAAVLDRLRPGAPLAAKIAPGVAQTHLARYDAEAEFISVDGELKECVLWFGPLRSAARRATVLPEGVSLTGEETGELPPLHPIGPFIFDPDPSIVRAGLSAKLAEQLQLFPIDHTVMTLTGPELISSPFATAYRVEHTDRVHAARLRTHLREHDVGRVTIVKRGSPVDADELMGKLKLAGSDHRVVVLTRAAGEPVAIVCERVTASSP